MYYPKVSIIIPVYNGSNYLNQAIQSALSQTYQNIEIIVVNDGSKDEGKTEMIARSYGDKIRYFEKENGGSSSALNMGIVNMEGEWFSWLSHDDLYIPDKVEIEIAYLRDLFVEDNMRRETIVFSGSELIDSKGRSIKKKKKYDMKKLYSEISTIRGNEFLIAQPRKFNFHGCSCLIHKTVFEKVGLFDEKLRYLNDVEMWFRLYAAGYKLLFVPKLLVKGRLHAQQVGRNLDCPDFYSESVMLWKRRINWLQKNHGDNEALLGMIGKDAYLSGRTKEGDLAFSILISLEPKKKILIQIKKFGYQLCAKARNLAKQLILCLRT